MSEAELLWNTVTGLSLLGNAALVYLKFTGKAEQREIKNDPLRTKEVEEFLTEKDLIPLQERVDNHADAIEGLRREAQSNYNAIMKSEAEGRSRLHEKINHLSEDVASVKAIVEPLKTMPERIARDIGILFGKSQRRD